MASVQDVFAQMQAEQDEVLADEVFTPDPDEYCTLESDATRRILIPQKYAVFGVESDDKTNRIKFAFPKAVNDIQDLSQYNLRFNYIDAKGNTDQITARNMQVKGDYVLFDWILTRNVTRYQGNISFIVCAVTVKEDGVISNEWNTTVATAQSLEGIETEPTPGEERIARDLLTELLVSLNNSKNDAITEITQTKTQAISDVETEGQTQISAVDAKGGQVIESIPDDYTTLENRVDELEQNRAYVIVGESSGEFITLNDSSELKTRNVKLFGKSVQAETTGAQLFNVNVCKNETDLQYKITIDDYATGKITVSIDNPEGAVAMPVNRLSDYCPAMTAGKTYYLSGKRDGSSIGDIRLLDVSDTWDFRTSREITEQDLQSAVRFGFGTYSNIMIVEGGTDKPYEVYTGGEAATEPTPEFPLPITSAGNYDDESEKYEMGILVANKNFASNVNVYSGYYANLSALKSPPDSRFICVSKIKIIPGVNYRISSNLKFYSIWSYDVNDNPIRRTNYGSSNTILLNATDKDVYIGISLHNTSGQADTTAFEFIQVEAGEEQTSYIDGKSQNTTLQIPNPLRGIPVDSGGNYTDADGQQWICDYIDKERGKYVQCVQEIVFDGVSSRKKVTGADQKYYSNANYAYIVYMGIKGYTAVIGNKLKYLGDNMRINLEGLLVTNVLSISLLNTRTGIVPTDSVQQRVDKINVVLKQWYDEGNPLIVYYQLANPIETDLTPDQISALNLSTYQGITNIGTDTMPQVGIDVEYIADTKTYIDNAISEAIAAIPTE